MIQRVQSIMLLLAAACFFSLFMLPFASTPDPDPGMNFLADGVFNIQDNIMFIVMTALAGGLALINIFNYKKRGLQLRIGYILIILAILIPLLAFLLFFQEMNVLFEDTRLDDQLGIFAPFVALIFLIIANRFIKKDEKLVRSMDRLR